MHDVSQQALIEEVAKDLRKLIGKPEWADYVKTGAHKERPPLREDWWYVRAAATLRKVHFRGPVGVSKLRTMYGGLKNRGVRPSAFARGSGSIARHILQELEQAGLIKQAEKGVHKGRITTPKGASLLFAAAKRIAPKQKPAKKEAPQKKPVDKPEPKKADEQEAPAKKTGQSPKAKEKKT